MDQIKTVWSSTTPDLINPRQYNDFHYHSPSPREMDKAHTKQNLVRNTPYGMPSTSNAELSNARTIIIIGGGVGGCCAALKLVEQGNNIILLEKNKLFSGSSSKTPGRMGLGFHYVDSKTAIMYLKATVDFVKAFPGFRIGDDLPWEHPYRHGRYFITKDSLFTPEQILTTYAEIQSAYAQLVAENPSNEVFGPPEKFYHNIGSNRIL